MTCISENEEIEEVFYQLDENNCLVDEKGNFIYDDSNKIIKLSEEHLQYLKSVNILEE